VRAGNLPRLDAVSVAEVVKTAFRAARAAAKRWLSAESASSRCAEHFIETWRAQLKQRTTLQRASRPGQHFCQVPGCSRAAVHAHHIKPRSQGGSDDPSNLISLCAAHHLHGIHRRPHARTGSARTRLAWEFGPPLPAQLRRPRRDTTDALDGSLRGCQGFAQSRRLSGRRVDARSRRCWQEETMSGLDLAIVLIVLRRSRSGLQQFSYTRKSHDADLGAVKVSIKEKETVDVPTLAGVAAIAPVRCCWSWEEKMNCRAWH